MNEGYALHPLYVHKVSLENFFFSQYARGTNMCKI